MLHDNTTSENQFGSYNSSTIPISYLVDDVKNSLKVISIIGTTIEGFTYITPLVIPKSISFAIYIVDVITIIWDYIE